MHLPRAVRRWKYKWKATADVVSVEQQRIGGAPVKQTAEISMDIEIETASEPWQLRLSSGPTTSGTHFILENGTFEGKYEQLTRVKGTVTCDDQSWNIDGVGLRTHVRGPRDTTDMDSHAWTGGLFSDGRGFTLKRLCSADGVAYYDEAFVTMDGTVHRAEVLDCPAIQRSPDDLAFTVRLKSDLGEVTIRAQNFQTDWHAMESWTGSGASAGEVRSGYEADAAKLDYVHNAMPAIRPEPRATGPADCLHLLNLHFASTYFLASYYVPEYAAWLASEPATGLYDTHKRVMQQLAWKRPPGQWVIKEPMHQLNIDLLFAAYPDAGFVQTHRDPAETLPTTASA